MRWLSRQNQIHNLKEDGEIHNLKDGKFGKKNIENEIISINQGYEFISVIDPSEKQDF